MKYFVILNGSQAGPFEVSELYNKGITPETLVWTEGMENWTPAWQVGELKAVINSSIAVAQPPKYEPDGPGASEDATPPPAPPKKRRHWLGTRSLVALLILAVLFVGMTLTVPPRQAHQDAIKQEFNAAMSQKMGQGAGVVESIIQMGSRYVAGLAAESALGQLLTVDNYFVCSVGTFNYEGKNRVASIGVFNHVFTVNKDDIVRALDRVEQAARDEQRKLADPDSPESLIKGVIDFVKDLI